MSNRKKLPSLIARDTYFIWHQPDFIRIINRQMNTSPGDEKNDSTKPIIKSATDIVFVAVFFFLIVGASYWLKFGGASFQLPPAEPTIAATIPVAPTQEKNPSAALESQKKATVERAALEERRASQAVWGQLGDYMGGLLNPILSFFALYLLMRNLQLQQVQIAQTENSLTAAAISNEIAALASALDVISEDVRQMQNTQGYSDTDAYRKSLDLKIWLGSEIAARAQKIGAKSAKQNT